MTFKRNNNNKILTNAEKKPDQKDQNKLVNKKSIPISIKPTANYSLTSQKQMTKIKEEYLTALQEINKSTILLSFVDFYKFELTNPQDPTKYVSLINDVFVLNPKIKLLSKNTTMAAMREKYQKLVSLNTCRCDIIYIIHNQIPETSTNIFGTSAMQYLKQSIDNIYPVNSLYEILDQIHEELANSYNDAIQNNQELSEEKYSLISKLQLPLTNFYAKLIAGFKSSYNIYKNILQLSLSTIQLKNTAVYEQARFLLLAQINNITPLNLTNFCDHHYFLHLLRVYTYGPAFSESYPVPLFSDLEKNQISGYFKEIECLLIISIIINIINKKDNAFNIFMNLPISQSINKKPSLFFGQHISKNTYSLLLAYLGVITMVLSNDLVKNNK
jgi:hypothetical protein